MHGLSLIVTTANTGYRLENMQPSRNDLQAVSLLAANLVTAGIRPRSVAFGGDYRAVGGFTFLVQLAKELGEQVSDVPDADASLRYPKYSDFCAIRQHMHEWGLRVIHRYLSEKMGHRGLWGESAQSFAKRMEMALSRPFPDPAVLLVPVEALVLWYYTKVEGIDQLSIPDDRDAWLPPPGATIAFSRDRMVVRAFDIGLRPLEAAPR